MATFYIQLENKLLQISGELTAENISKALGYVPVDSSTLNNYATKEEVSSLVDMSMVEELSQRVDNISFDNLKDNPFLQDGSGELNIVDEAGNIIAKIDAEGIHSVDFIAGNHKLTDKIDSSALNGYAKESWVNTNLSNYATKDEVSDLVDMSVVTELQGKVDTLVGEDADKSVRDITVDVLTETLVSETATEAYDTLAEMSAWIKSHPEDATAMNTAIQKNAEDITNLDAAYKAADTKVLTDAQEYTDNINFYTIKDNPIVDGEAGSITFVDETGYIGLKVTEDGIIAKDVVTPEHTLSSKADKSFVEDNYYNKSTVDKKITEAVTGGQVSLDGFATEQWVNEQGFLKDHQDISHLAEKSELPTKTSDLTNDSGFITINDVPVLEIPEEYVTETELNDKGFLTKHQDISHLASRTWVESQGYAHQEDLLEISFNDIQDSPISIDDSGMINFVDESGNVCFQINEDGLRVTDVIAGEHKLSQKANASDIPSLDGYAKTEDIPSLDGFAKTEDIPSLDGYAKLTDIPELPDIPSLDGYATEEWVNNKNYATEYDLKTIDYSSINNVPVSEDETGELNIADENGNIGMKVSSEAVYAKDFIASSGSLNDALSRIVQLEDTITDLLNRIQTL